MGLRVKSVSGIVGTLVTLATASSAVAVPPSIQPGLAPLGLSQLAPEDATFQGTKQSPIRPRRRFLPFTGFGCESYRDSFPITVGYTENGPSLIYAWRKDYYFETGETPSEICFRVSRVLESLNDQGLLNTISARRTSPTSHVICAADDCSWPIFTISSPESPREVISDLYAALTGAAPSRRSSGGAR